MSEQQPQEQNNKQDASQVKVTSRKEEHYNRYKVKK